jgi:hypothetical protein
MESSSNLLSSLGGSGESSLFQFADADAVATLGTSFCSTADIMAPFATLSTTFLPNGIGGVLTIQDDNSSDTDSDIWAVLA